MKYYLVGYGSLLSTKSRNKTGNSGEEFAIKISGFKRSWNIQVDHKRIGKTTFLGITKDRNSWFNATLFEIKKNDIIEFDKREKSYTKFLLSKNHIDFYKTNLKKEFDFENSKIYIYLNNPKFEGFPSNEYLISQAYIDICILGCLDFSKEFTNDFIRTTTNWSNCIRYNRDEQSKHIFYSKKQLREVDFILKENKILI